LLKETNHSSAELNSNTNNSSCNQSKQLF